VVFSFVAMSTADFLAFSLSCFKISNSIGFNFSGFDCFIIILSFLVGRLSRR